MKPKSRAELIAAYNVDPDRHTIAAAAIDIALASTAAPPPKAPPADDEPDDAQVMSAIDAAIALQEKDPDGSSDPNDAKVLAALMDAKKAQEADEAGEASVTAASVPNEQECSGCQHLASAHEDTSDGANTGKCSMEGCDCPGMEEVRTDETGSKNEEQLAAPGVAETEPVADTDQNPPPEVEGAANLGPAFTGVLVIEGQPTGDGREIAADALTWRDLPLPLMLLKTETHDPAGFDMNDPAVICGRIDSVTRSPGEGSTQLLEFGGNFLSTEEGIEAAELAEQMGRLGVSGDIAVQDRDIQVTETDDYGFPTEGTETVTDGTIMGATVCPFPAFQGCYLMLEGSAGEPQQIPQAAEPPEAVTAGGQLVHWMSFEECEPCAEGLDVVTASGAGPTRPPVAWFEDPGFEDGDGRLVEILGSTGRRENLHACPITVTEHGQVFGHIAPWGVCHKGINGSCVTAPKSAVDYAHFKRGQHITTAEGEQVRVGVLTADVGHASTRLSAAGAMSHYDDTATVVADVNIGNDAYGIWVAGAVRPDATDAQIRKLTASSISGDWRNIGGQLELVAALCVNEPGFPLAVVASGHQETLLAYGAAVMDRLAHPAETKRVTPVQKALGRMLREDARKRVAALT